MTKPLVKLIESTKYPGLFTKKYARHVFYDNLWNEELVESRGRVLLKDGTVVVNPFTKIFNYGENGTTIDRDEQCLVVQKINGFMAAATFVAHGINKVVVSTTGSLDSDFVAMAEEYITDRVKTLIEEKYAGFTLLFEICHPNDPHIIKERPGAYLIGARWIKSKDAYFSTLGGESTLDFMAKELGVYRPSYTVGRFSDVVEYTRHVQHEGFVVYGQDSGKVLKIKSPYYLALKAAARVKDIAKLNKSKVDEEFYPLIEHLQSLPEYGILSEQAKLTYIRNYYA